MECPRILVSIWKKLKLRRSNSFKTIKHSAGNWRLRSRSWKPKGLNLGIGSDNTTLSTPTRANDIKT